MNEIIISFLTVGIQSIIGIYFFVYREKKIHLGNFYFFKTKEKISLIVFLESDRLSVSVSFSYKVKTCLY